MCISTILKLVPVIPITLDSWQIVKSGTINLSTLSEATSTPVCLMCRKGYINGAHGAACTLELKKKVRYKLEKELQHWDGQVWGFDYDPKEINRAIRLKTAVP